MPNWLSPVSGAAPVRIWMNPNDDDDEQKLQPPASPCPPSEAVGDGAGRFVPWAHQLEASSETPEQHPCDPVLTIAASTGWSKNETWWHARLRATEPGMS